MLKIRITCDDAKKKMDSGITTCIEQLGIKVAGQASGGSVMDCTDPIPETGREQRS